MKKAVIFDLDGVIVSTDHFHYLAWKALADQYGIPFDEKRNDRLRGISRMDSLEIILENTGRDYSFAEKRVMASYKNDIYRTLLAQLTQKDVLPGVTSLLDELDRRDIKKAIGSSSKNTRMILEKLGLIIRFDIIADGTMIEKSKPDPEVFSLAISMLGVNPMDCVVVEDAEAGIQAAKAAGAKAFAVGSANKCDIKDDGAADLNGIDVDRLLR